MNVLCVCFFPLIFLPFGKLNTQKHPLCLLVSKRHKNRNNGRTCRRKVNGKIHWKNVETMLENYDMRVCEGKYEAKIIREMNYKHFPNTRLHFSRWARLHCFVVLLRHFFKGLLTAHAAGWRSVLLKDWRPKVMRERRHDQTTYIHSVHLLFSCHIVCYTGCHT